MTIPELKKYLSMVVDMEKSIFMQEQLLKQLDGAKNRLCVQREIAKPVMPSRPKEEKSSSGIGVIIAGLVFWRIGRGYGRMGIGVVLLGVLLLLVGISIFISDSDIRKRNKTAAQYYQNDMQRYQQAVNLYNKEISAQKKRIASEIPKKLAIEAQQRQVLREINKSRNVLNKLYSYDIIFSKYRKLEYVCSLYEYLCAGRCSTLKERFSKDGGYNILEEEIRMDRLILQVERVANNLESIKYTQAQLYNVVVDSNQKLNRIIDSTDRMAAQVSYLGTRTAEINSRLADLQRSSDLTAYYSERNNKHLEYMNWMNYYSGRYKNAGYHNMAPSY